ncbi:hypothetical protein [Lactococcus garvieae]|uniref:hypothetical protein n=1 Tax=Lactococcus garvieae TaxID=1363 RepID=UPI0022E753EF|nr:hypothetical protein [Lactococcus garvieae]
MVKVQEYTSGDEFKDISKKGKDRHWKERKRKNVKLAGAFKRLNGSVAKFENQTSPL